MYIKSILIISILYLLIKSNILIETINQPTICGNLRNSEINYSDPNPPFRIKRCLRGSWDNPGTPKTNPKCCGGIHECKPTKYGGYCQSKTDHDYKFIYEDDSQIPYDERTRLSETEERRYDAEDREEIIRDVLGDIINNSEKKEQKDFDKMVINILNYAIIIMFICFIGLLIYLLIKPEINESPTKITTETDLHKKFKIKDNHSWYNPKKY